MIAHSTDWTLEPAPSRTELALADIADALSRWRLWSRMAREDIRQRYRRSLLGPFWLTLSLLLMIAMLGVLYGRILNVSLRQYLPFLALGLLFWNLIADVVREGCNCFILYEQLIRQIRLPLMTHVFRTIARNILIASHNFAVFIILALVFRLWPGPAALWIIPGMILLVANLTWLCLFLGMLSARFRDVPPLINSLLQIVFFVSPIVWGPSALRGKTIFVQLNPVYHGLELVRGPLLGHAPDLVNWLVCLGITAAGWAVTFPFFVRFRSRLPYWL